VTNGADRSVSSIDPVSHLVQRFPVGDGPAGVAMAAGSVWVTNSLDGTLTRLDAGSGSTQATIPVGNSPISVAAIGRAIWVSNEFSSPATLPGNKTVSQADRDSGSLMRIDPRSDQVDLTVRVAGAPRSLASAAGGLWATASGIGRSHRGGTLKLEVGNMAPAWAGQSIDPVQAYDRTTERAVLMTSDGLVAFRHAGGATGTTLVPDLATSLPAPTDAGKAYVFRLRKGIRYSTGLPVRASDFRRALQRAYAIPNTPAAPYFTDIVGAQNCQKNRSRAVHLDRNVVQHGRDSAGYLLKLRSSRCDLSRGVVTDDAAGTVTFHLTRPDPDFFYKLAEPWAVAVPPGTAERYNITEPVPGTGPYKITKYLPGKTLELTRNPSFREWSRAAQPDGYPDRIVFGAAEPGAALDMVLNGKADLASGPFPGRMAELRTRHPAQLRTNLGPFISYLPLGTRTRPFNDVLARRAFNYALDRSRWARLVGSTKPTCQMLPEAFPGYAPYCPYRHDLPQARRLVARSGTAGDHVDVVCTPDARRVCSYFASVLGSIGYPSRVRIRPISNYWTDLVNLRGRFQVGWTGWGADFPSPVTYFDPMLACRYAPPGTNGGFNFGHYCDHQLDALVRRADELQQSQPAEAGRLWAQADRRMVDRAAIVPLGIGTDVTLLSKRVGGYQYQPILGEVLDQLWVR
jgi:peptide/nickel transport system substrate-binding protein